MTANPAAPAPISIARPTSPLVDARSPTPQATHCSLATGSSLEAQSDVAGSEAVSGGMSCIMQ